MRKKSLAFSLACVLLASCQYLVAQNTPSHGIRGYLDPRTGTFHILPSPTAEDTVEPAVTPVTGKFVFTFTITVDATISATAKIACSAAAIVEDSLTSGSPKIIEEEASAAATRSGTTATCTVNIPYSWTLATGSTDKVMLSYSIAAPAEAALSASLPSRFSNVENFATISVPANGTTTNEAVTATF